jgi:hypothetical protein
VLAALRDRPAEPAHLLGALMAATADRAGARVVGEKTPEHLRHIPELLAALPGLRVICLQRDGRDVVLSLMRAPFTHDWLRVHCHRWLDAVTLAGDLAERHAERFRIVRFEDLVADPDTTLAEVGVFLDIDGANSSRESSPPGILVPSRELAWKSKALSPPDSSRIAAWRREPDTRRLAIIEGILAESLLALGHPLDATPRVSLKDRALSIFARIAYRAGYHGLRNRLPESARNALQRTMKIVTR